MFTDVNKLLIASNYNNNLDLVVAVCLYLESIYMTFNILNLFLLFRAVNLHKNFLFFKKKQEKKCCETDVCICKLL